MLLILMLNFIGVYLATQIVFAADITDVVTAGETAEPTEEVTETPTPETTQAVSQDAATLEPTVTPTVTPTPTPQTISSDDTDFKTQVIEYLAVIQQFLTELRTLAYGAVVFVICVILFKLLNWLF